MTIDCFSKTVTLLSHYLRCPLLFVSQRNMKVYDKKIKHVKYDSEIWAIGEYHTSLADFLTAKDCLLVLHNGKPPYKVVLGVPHQAAVGEDRICERGESRNSDENAASYALVVYSTLVENDSPCKLVIMAHSTKIDPNKKTDSPYCKEIFKDPTELILECHGAGPNRLLDLELSAGSNDLAKPIEFGRVLFSSLERKYTLGVQKKPGADYAIIFKKNGTQTEGKLQLPGNETTSLIEARKRKIPAMHLEAKPAFRIPQDRSNSVSPDGLNLGRSLAQSIITFMGSREENKRIDWFASRIIFRLTWKIGQVIIRVGSCVRRR